VSFHNLVQVLVSIAGLPAKIKKDYDVTLLEILVSIAVSMLSLLAFWLIHNSIAGLPLTMMCLPAVSIIMADKLILVL